MTTAAHDENPAKRPFRDAVAMTTGPAGADAAVVQAGIRSGKSRREIAVDLWGADRVATDWHPGGWMWAQVRRLVRRAWAASGGGPDDADIGTP